MGTFVQQDGASILPIVIITDIDIAHPTEGGAIAHMTINGDMVVFLLAPQATMMHGLTDLEHLEQAQAEHQHHTYYIYPGHTCLPFPCR